MTFETTRDADFKSKTRRLILGIVLGAALVAAEASVAHLEQFPLALLATKRLK